MRYIVTDCKLMPPPELCTVIVCTVPRYAVTSIYVDESRYVVAPAVPIFTVQLPIVIDIGPPFVPVKNAAFNFAAPAFGINILPSLLAVVPAAISR